MEITKKKLPKGLTYPLSSELLNGALSSGGFNTPVVLRYSANSQLLAARYYLRRPWDDIECFVVSSGPVDSRDSEEANEYLVKTIVPEFVAWAHELASLPASSSRFTGHQFLQWVSPKNKYNSVSTVAIGSLIAEKSHK